MTRCRDCNEPLGVDDGARRCRDCAWKRNTAEAHKNTAKVYVLHASKAEHPSIINRKERVKRIGRQQSRWMRRARRTARTI